MPASLAKPPTQRMHHTNRGRNTKMHDLTFLFFSALLAATLFPAQSELMVLHFAHQGDTHPTLLLLTATIGNVLGALINWYLGYRFLALKKQTWFPMKAEKVKKYSKLYLKFGSGTLLFAWLPIVGDAFTVIAGIFKLNIWKFLILVTLGKGGRYLFIMSII
jgi:membrane protein YqaA with SNARE-associated domain